MRHAWGARRRPRLTLLAFAAALAGAAAVGHIALRADPGPPPALLKGYVGDPSRGLYISRLAGCVACHTDQNDGLLLAGGRRLQTPFGTFVSPNITPSPRTGIGGWTREQFHAALTHGVSPSGGHYFPAFPYTSYTRMTARDVADLKAHLDRIEPIENDVPNHELDFPFNVRALAGLWKLIFFRPGEFTPNPSNTERHNRGDYIVNGPGHCAECHSPRNLLGGLGQPALSGTDTGPDGETVPPLRGEGALDGWTTEDVVFALQVGMLPDGDALGGSMGEVIEEGTGHLNEEDLAAIAEYLLAK